MCLYILYYAQSLSYVRLFETPWTAAHQAPLSIGFSRKEYWSGVPLPSPPLRLRHPQNSTRRETKFP